MFCGSNPLAKGKKKHTLSKSLDSLKLNEKVSTATLKPSEVEGLKRSFVSAFTSNATKPVFLFFYFLFFIFLFIYLFIYYYYFLSIRFSRRFTDYRFNRCRVEPVLHLCIFFSIFNRVLHDHMMYPTLFSLLIAPTKKF